MTTQHQRNKENFDAVITNSLSKLNTALLNKNIPVRDSDYAIAYTDGKTINLDLAQIRSYAKNDAEFLSLVKALNIHENGHIQITDYSDAALNRVHDELKKLYYTSRDFHDLLNSLEDTRLENHVIKKYPFCENDLNNAFALLNLPNILKLTMFNKSDMTTLQVYSRLIGTNHIREDSKYKKVIEVFKNEFMKIKDADKLESLFKSYLNIGNKRGDNIRRLNAAMEIFKLLDTNANDRREQQLKRQQEDRQKQDGEQKETEKDESQNEYQEDKSNGAGNTETQKGLKSNIDNGILNKLTEELQKITRETIKHDEKLKSELKEIEKTANSGYFVTTQMNNSIKLLKSQIQQIKNKKIRGISHEQKNGKFSIKDFIKNQNSDRNFNKVFVRKNDSTIDALKMSVCLLVDSSGSMKNTEHKTQMDTAYIISKTLEDTNNKIEIIEFSAKDNYHIDTDGYKVIKPFSTKLKDADLSRHFEGMTNIVPPLKQAARDLAGLDNKYVIIITDGGLFRSTDSDELTDILDELKRNNTLVYCITIKTADDYGIFDKEVHLNNIEDVNDELRKIILDIQSKLILKYKR